MLSQAQPAIPRPTRLFLRQLRASHLGSELEGESSPWLGSCRGYGCRHLASLFLSVFPSLIGASNFCLLPGTGDLCCMAELDNPAQQKRTKSVRAGPEVEWTEDLAL